MTDIVKIVAVVNDKASKPLVRIDRQTEKLRKNISNALDGGAGAAKRFEQRIKEVSAGIEAQQKALRGLQREILAISLSIMFVGFAIRRFTDKAFRGLTNTMQNVTDDTHEFNVLTNRLRANWEFMKFTLMDALMQSGLFQWFIERLIQATQWVSNLSDRQRQWIVISLALAAVLGTVMIVAGQFGTLLAGGLLKKIGLTKWLIAGITKLKAAFALSFGAGIKAALVLLGPWLLIIAAFTAIVAGLWFVYKNWDLVWNGIKIVFFTIIRMVADAWDWTINKMIDGINWVIRQINRIPGVEIGQLGRTSMFQDVGTWANNQVWDLTTEREAMREQPAPQAQQQTNNYDIDVNMETDDSLDLSKLLEDLERQEVMLEGSAV